MNRKGPEGPTPHEGEVWPTSRLPFVVPAPSIGERALGDEVLDRGDRTPAQHAAADVGRGPALEQAAPLEQGYGVHASRRRGDDDGTRAGRAPGGGQQRGPSRVVLLPHHDDLDR